MAGDQTRGILLLRLFNLSHFAAELQGLPTQKINFSVSVNFALVLGASDDNYGQYSNVLIGSGILNMGSFFLRSQRLTS